ncbi:MAG: tetratricopeptide repeat protein [Sulfurovum sp.]|uniref:tetratricopeptide repeat protein n=1 Tax=Sulfurovum sp. TaxID=1969726 RepID=UPI003C717FB1
MISILNKYVAHYACIVLAGTVFTYAEPSVYGFGSTETTSDVQTSGSSTNSIAALKQQIAQQDERIDGLTTIIEGLSASINELQLSGGMNTSTIEGNDSSNTALLKKLAGMIDEINANYVSKEEFQNALGSTNKVKTKTSTKTATKKKETIQGKSNAQLYSEGVRFFVKKRYDEAQKRFAITDIKGYKPAASNYYLGEIAYYTKKYEDAIFYFKKSAGIYDKASYIDTLLLHTAVSLEKSGDKGQAKAFYENIIENYPGKKSAKIAKERLKKL